MEGGQSLPQVSAAPTTATSRTWACRSCLKSIEKLDDYTVRFRLNRPEAPFLGDLAMPFNSVQSAEYADYLLKAGTPEKIDQEPIGTGPFQFLSFEPNIAVRYRAFDWLLGRPAADRHAGLLHHSERGRAADEAQGRRVPRDRLPESRATSLTSSPIRT